MIRKLRDIPIFRRAALVASAVLILAALINGGTAAQEKDPDQRGRLIERTLHETGKNYYDPDRIEPQRMLSGALDEMQLSVPEMLVDDAKASKLNVTVGLASRQIGAKPMASLGDLSRTLREVLSFTLAHYRSDDDTPPEEVEYAAADGMLKSLDPHSGFLPPKVLKEFKIGTKGNFGGLGIVISIKDGMLTVIAPIEGTPASAAGIMAGDRILQIDDESTINMSLTDAVNKLRGDVGSKVTIAIETQGKPIRKMTLARALINIESVKHAVLAKDGKRIGYIRIKNFQSNTDSDVGKALAAMRKGGAAVDGLILDMRNNPGGLLNIAVDVADRFLGQGVIVTTVGARGRVMDKDEAKGTGVEPDYPVVILVNEGSASAAEIVAGALALNDRAVIAGQRTFGKGSVQTVMDVGEGSAVKLTIAQYKPAGRQSIQVRGIAPDIALIPATVDADEVNIVEDKPRTEKDLEHALAGEAASEGPLAEPKFRVQYMAPKRDEKWLEEKSKREYSREPDISGDFEVEFARDLLAKAAGASAAEMLKKSGPVIKAAQESQRKAMADALTKIGIDWKISPTNGKPTLKTAHRLLKDGKAVPSARAGDKVRLEVSATNAGGGAASQLIAVAESETVYLDGIEFPLGKLRPGETKGFSAQVEIPESEPSAERTLRLKLMDAAGALPSVAEISLQIEELPHPAFSFEMRLPSAAKGRPMPKNAAIPVTVDITNTGKGASGDETIVTLSNECGERLFIEKGRSKIGVLPPGAKRRAGFSFHMVDGKQEKEGCALKLSIADFKHLNVLSKKFELMTESGSTRPQTGRIYGPPTIETAPLARSTSAAWTTVSGKVKDSDPVRDIFVYVKNRKVAYVPNAEESNTMEFSVRVPLEEGPNNIMIGARDVQDLTARRILAVERRKATPPAGKK
ncbi:MAG: PDZ domain-containing protein [Proteobacteria bacterium]|nr:PDZ domain-containing protein [Pseudomonadota bacterium]